MFTELSRNDWVFAEILLWEVVSGINPTTCARASITLSKLIVVHPIY